jgi:Neuraminidase (sialidase)
LFEVRTLPVPIKPDKRAIYDQHPYSWNGMPMVARIPDGRLFLAWIASRGFAGGGRIAGAFSSDGGQTWTDPTELINNPDRDDGDPSILVDGDRLNVISSSIRLPDHFDKFNIFPVRYDRAWWWMTTTSDGGRTWSKPVELPIPHAYPGKHANGLRLRDGTLVIPYYYGTGAEAGQTPRLERDIYAVASVVRSKDHGRTWTDGPVIRVPGSVDASEPAAVVLSSGEMYCLIRNLAGALYATRSRDSGSTWSEPHATPLRGRNSPLALYRLDDSRGDELVAAWNNVPGQRWPLVISYSADGGTSWSAPKVLSAGNSEKQYRADNPGLGQASDGTIIAVWHEENLPRHLGKEVRIARFNREWLLSK